MNKRGFRCLAGLFAAVLLIFGGCAKPEYGVVADPSSSTVSSAPQIKYTEEWPHNSFTAQIPKPETGTVQWVLEDPQNRGFSIALMQATRSGVERYLQELESAGFRTVKKQLLPPQQMDTVIYLGTNGRIAVSLQYTSGSFGMYLSENLQGIT